MGRLACLVLVATLGCGSEGSGAAADAGSGAAPRQGRVVLSLEQGVAFASGEVQRPGTFLNSDLRATAGGNAPKLSTGGRHSADDQPALWLRSTYTGLAGKNPVPADRPTSANGAMVDPKVGNGFVIRNFVSGGYTRGFIEAADAQSITILYDFQPE